MRTQTRTFLIKASVFMTIFIAMILSFSIGAVAKANELNVELAKIHNGAYFKANGKLYRAVEMQNE